MFNMNLIERAGDELCCGAREPRVLPRYLPKLSRWLQSNLHYFPPERVPKTKTYKKYTQTKLSNENYKIEKYIWQRIEKKRFQKTIALLLKQGKVPNSIRHPGFMGWWNRSTGCDVGPRHVLFEMIEIDAFEVGIL